MRYIINANFMSLASILFKRDERIEKLIMRREAHSDVVLRRRDFLAVDYEFSQRDFKPAGVGAVRLDEVSGVGPAGGHSSSGGDLSVVEA